MDAEYMKKRLTFLHNDTKVQELFSSGEDDWWSIGQTLYSFCRYKEKSTDSKDEQTVWDFVYAGTDFVTIEILCQSITHIEEKICGEGKVRLKLPLNKSKQALFEPGYDKDMKTFILEMQDDFGHITTELNSFVCSICLNRCRGEVFINSENGDEGVFEDMERELGEHFRCDGFESIGVCKVCYKEFEKRISKEK